ncbi:MAG TPA: 4Fe-4S binding protein, partial [Burkholderiaceae bacterium]|nr:4Fe-4S binding protein [Burkholderiaceae bacterium]
IDVCSTRAIAAAGDHVRVEPYLCMGCGACASVCPTGAMTYAAPSMPDLGQRVRAMLGAFARAGGKAPALLITEARGMQRLSDLGAAARTQQARGLPASLVPLEVLHVASVGPDASLAALAAGASRIRFLVDEKTAPTYINAIREHAELINTIVAGLGWSEDVVDVIEAHDIVALDNALNAQPNAPALVPAAQFAWQAVKRATLGMALEHLHRHSPHASQTELVVDLPAGAPFGTVAVDASACTLCMSCVGQCPTNALAAGQDTPALKFFEANCVQCGLCASSCPEDAITLKPRIAFGASARSARTVAQTRPYECIRCHKPFGTARMIEAMLAKLGSHAVFSGAIDRLRMCADCRVIDVFSSGDEARVIGVGESTLPKQGEPS